MKRLIGILLVLALTLMPSATLVSADSSCVPNRQADSVHRYAGWYETAQTGHTITGIKATLEQQTVYTTPFSHTRFWILLSDGSQFVQAGFDRANSNGFNTDQSQDFIAGSSPPYFNGLGHLTPIDGTATWQIDYTGSIIEVLRNNVYQSGYPSSFAFKYGEVIAETFSFRDQMYGGNLDQADAINIKYQVDGSSTWQTFGSSPYTNATFPLSSSVYGRGYTESAGHLWTWDKACN